MGLITEMDSGIEIHRVADPDEAAWWRDGVAEGYCRVFGGFPYFERYEPDQAAAIYDKLLATPNHIVLVAADGEDVAGFAAAIPLVHRPDVAHQLQGLVPLRHTFYLAELGVLPEYRGRRIGRTLVRERLRLIQDGPYSHVVLRVSADNTPSGEMYKALGFTDMGVYMDVRSPRVDGEVRADRRLFLSRVLSQVDLDEP